MSLSSFARSTVLCALAVASISCPVVAATATSTGNIALDWIPPTQNHDGTTLTNLAGYRVHYGRSPSQMTQSITIRNPGLTSYVVDDLAPGTWYFAVTSYTSVG